MNMEQSELIVPWDKHLVMDICLTLCASEEKERVTVRGKKKGGGGGVGGGGGLIGGNFLK